MWYDFSMLQRKQKRSPRRHATGSLAPTPQPRAPMEVPLDSSPDSLQPSPMSFGRLILCCWTHTGNTGLKPGGKIVQRLST